LARLFFLLSGEHKDLPASELTAVLTAEGFAYKVSEKLDQVIRLDAEISCVEAVKRRAALTRVCGLEFFSCEAKMGMIVKMIPNVNLNNALAEEQDFAVRVKRVKNYAPSIREMALEATLGRIIREKNPNARVNLKSPSRVFIGVLTQTKFVFGLKLAEISAKPFVERRPRGKPFFHPSAMQAKLARCMVNLARPRQGDLVFDPLCGTGSTLIEASLIGCRTLGVDVQRRMARGTIRNFEHFKMRPDGIVVADVRCPPITRVDCVVTDPPYGTSSTTMRRTTRQIVEELLVAADEILVSGNRVCVASPKTLSIARIGKDFGYKHLESYFVYVHRSLTREIAVFEKA